VDFTPPNVVFGGGLTQCARVAAMASAFDRAAGSAYSQNGILQGGKILFAPKRFQDISVIHGSKPLP